MKEAVNVMLIATVLLAIYIPLEVDKTKTIVDKGLKWKLHVECIMRIPEENYHNHYKRMEEFDLCKEIGERLSTEVVIHKRGLF